LCAIDPATYSRSEKKTLKKGTNLASRMNNNLLKDRHYLSIQKHQILKSLSILPKIATTIVQLLSYGKIDDIK
jgi:hypothetical protein